MSKLETLIKWDTLARAHYTYEYDDIQYRQGDDWRSHADDVLAGARWKDDCDGLASTVIDLLDRDGYESDKMFRVICSSTGTQTPDHFVGMASDGEGLYIVGDTFGPVYSVKKIQHRILAVSRISDGIEWHKVNHEDFLK